MSSGTKQEGGGSSSPFPNPGLRQGGAEDRPPIRTYRGFWAYYVGKHQRPLTRLLHLVGTTGAVLCVLAAVLSDQAWLLLGAPVVSYGLAWIGHFVVENNAPATFRYPLRSLVADFHMYGLMCAGRMDDEVRRLTAPQATSSLSRGRRRT